MSSTPRPSVPPSHTPYADGDHAVVGHSCRRLDGVDKVTGAIKYGADLFPSQADLFAAVARSEHAHARILSIDTSAAEQLEGVLGVYTSRDVPGTNRHGLIFRDHPVLAENHVRYFGDAIAVIVAESERAAREACGAVQVEYEPLPVVDGIDAALAEGAPRLHPDGNVMGGKRIRKGDADQALAEADVVITETFQTQTVDHAFLDLEAGIARFDPAEDGRLTIYACGQWIHEERRLVALALGLGPERIRIIQPATGGAFGGREDISVQIYLGLAAMHHPNQTIALRYDRAESVLARHKRHAVRIEYTLGAKRDGTLVAAKATFWSDEGAYASTGPAVMRKAASHATGPYRVPNVHVDVYGVFTNNNPTGAMRGFGAVQAATAYEGMMDRLARELGRDRIELRLQNLVRSGDAVTTGQVLPQATAVDCVEAAMNRFCHPEPGMAKFEEPPEPHLRRGMGLSVICFGLGYGDGFPDASRARVKFEDDGTAVIYTGAVDYGQGLINVVAQIVADELGLPLAQIRVVSADTGLTDEAGSTSATRQTYFTGNAVKLAADELKDELLDIAAQLLQIHPHEIKLADGFATGRYEPDRRASIAELVAAGRERGYRLDARSLFRPRTVCEDFDTGQSPRAFITYLFAAHVCQVLVDIETGEVRVERHIACHDVGKAINPRGVEGQMAGGVAQGIGMALMEEVIARDGRILNANFTDYILPTIHDIPPVECVILENDDPGGPFGARGVGEPPVIGAVPAVVSALGAALGTMPCQLPCNPERIWRMLQPAK